MAREHDHDQDRGELGCGEHGQGELGRSEPGHGEHGHGEHEHEHEHVDAQHELDDDERAELAEREALKRIALAQIRQYGDPALRMRADEVEVFDEELARLAERMTGLMHDAEGIGLAATQVGVVRRLFVFTHDGEDRVLVNPVISARGTEIESDEEGCLSLGPVRVPVERHVEVTVEARDVSGAPFTLELDGYAARIVQHEIDHLDGTLMIDRTDEESRRRALAVLRPRLVLTR